MPNQPGIFALGSRSHHHLEFRVADSVPVDTLRDALAGLMEPGVTVGGLNLVIGFGARLWGRLEPGAVPAGLRDFSPVEGAGGRAPATQADVWVWVHGSGYDVVLDGARAVTAALGQVGAELALEQPSFVYHDSRDLTGFVDGTENPTVAESAMLLGGEGLLGDAFALTMRWVHDLESFHRLDLDEQEAVFGRTKADSREREDRPEDSHISRVVIEDAQGEELEVFRRSAPFGTVGEQGLHFVAFTPDLDRIDAMLGRMFATDGHGPPDRLLRYSRPVSGSYWYLPPVERLPS